MSLRTAVNTILSLFVSNNWKADPWHCSITCIQQGNCVVVWVVVGMLHAQVGSLRDSKLSVMHVTTTLKKTSWMSTEVPPPLTLHQVDVDLSDVIKCCLTKMTN